jgi:uncharacterized protein YbbC (DUF1343 family)
MIQKSVQCGIDLIPDESMLPVHLSYGILTNEAAINLHGIPVLQVLSSAHIQIVKIFSPEHGYHSKGTDGHYQNDHLSVDLSVPVISLYGDQLKPSPRHLIELDAMIIDLPNIGSRFYTYLWSMTFMLEACDEAGIPVFILDRPNPLGGLLDSTEGPIMKSSCFSFIGNWSIPIRFGLTIGELALLMKKEKKLNSCDINVIKVVGWTRSMNILQYAYLFTPPSPAIRSPNTIFTIRLCVFWKRPMSAKVAGHLCPFK